MTFDEMLDELRSGIADGRNDEVYEALDVRRALLNASAIQAMRIGSRVVTLNNVKPAHRALKWATVEELKPRAGNVVIRFDDRPDQRWTWPASQLALLPQQQEAACDECGGIVGHDGQCR